MLKRTLLTLSLLALAFPAVAQPDLEPVRRSEAPAVVLAQTDCDNDDGEEIVMRARAFGAVVFRVRCPGNNANYREAVIFADDASGRHAALMRFPMEDRLPPVTELANVRLFEAARAIGEIAVDDEGAEAAGFCRAERLWRLVRDRPVLVFRRTSRRCEAGGPWRVRLDRRTRAERALDWR